MTADSVLWLVQSIAQLLATHPVSDYVVAAPLSAVFVWFAKLTLEIQRGQRETNLLLFGDREKGELGVLARIRGEIDALDGRVASLELAPPAAPVAEGGHSYRPAQLPTRG